MKYIEFVFGTHGNFLTYVCNKLFAATQTDFDPFTKLGTAHVKPDVYRDTREFFGRHWFQRNIQITDSDIIFIVVTNPLSNLILYLHQYLRVGDAGIDVNYLEHDTYNKLVGSPFETLHWQIVDKYAAASFDGYNAVKDATWPTVTTMAEFDDLPDWIKDECANAHQLFVYEYNKENPNCPRGVLREIIKLEVADLSNIRLAQAQDEMLACHGPSNREYFFPFEAFYDQDRFFAEVVKLSEWLGKPMDRQTVHGQLRELYQKFVDGVQSKELLTNCLQFLKKIEQRELFDTRGMLLLEEAFIESMLEQTYNVEMPFRPGEWYTDSSQIYKVLGVDCVS